MSSLRREITVPSLSVGLGERPKPVKILYKLVEVDDENKGDFLREGEADRIGEGGDLGEI